MKYCDKAVEKKLLQLVDEYIFSEQLCNWSMDRLANDAGMAKNTLYKIVGSKEQLIKDVLLARVRKKQKKVLAAVAGEQDFPAAVRKMAVLIPEMIAGLYTPLIGLVRGNPSFEAVMVQERAQLAAMLRKKLEQGVLCGDVRPDVDLDVFFKVCQGTIIYFIKHEPDDSFQKNLGKALMLILQGIMTQRGERHD